MQECRRGKSLAGIEIPENMDGRSLLPLLEDANASIHDSLPLINKRTPAPPLVFNTLALTGLLLN